MQFFTDVFVGFLAFFISATTGVAERIESVFDTTAPEYTAEDTNLLERLPSAYQAIPKILIENASYQSAAVQDSRESWLTTADQPLDALVNILCTFTTDTYIKTTTGTGFFIHPDGVVLTNAHVAQFLLLEATDKAGKTTCIGRTGNPATPKYELSLLYIPPAWITEHADLIDAAAPSGTGERDYALLYTSSGLNNEPMPRIFPAVAPEVSARTLEDKDRTIALAGYPAGVFQTQGPESDLIPVLAETTISDFYTFDETTADVIAVRGSAIGEQGSSGGPIFDAQGKVIGVISTRGNDAVDGEGSLRGITVDYINRTIKEETGFSLLENATGNLPYRAKVFSNTLAPFLTSILVNEIGG